MLSSSFCLTLLTADDPKSDFDVDSCSNEMNITGFLADLMAQEGFLQDGGLVPKAVTMVFTLTKL